MTTVKALIERLQEDYKPDDVLAVAMWGLEDMRQICGDSDIDISEADMLEALEDIDRHQDATIGITWDTLEFYAGEYKK